MGARYGLAYTEEQILGKERKVMFKTKRLMSMLLITAMVLGMTGCGKSSSTQESSGKNQETTQNSNDKIVLTFWNNFTADDGEVLKQIVKEFNETNTKNIEVQMDVMPAETLNEKLPLSISSKTGPDFFATGCPFFAGLVENGAVKDLSGFWDVEGVDKSDFTEGSLDLMSIDGTQYFLPLQIQGFYLFWNKTLFEKAGLDPEKGPKTWDEVWEYAEKIADPDNNIWGFGMPVAASDATNTLYNWMLNEGTTLYNEDYSEVLFDNEKTLGILSTISEEIYEKKVGPEAPAQADLANLMNSGQLGMIANGPWMNTGLRNNEIDYGISVIPKGSSNEDVAMLLGVGYGISSCTDDSKVEAIYEFFKYWNSTENCKRWSLECGFPAYLKSVMEDPEVLADQVISTMSSQIEYAKPYMVDNSMSTVINNEIINPMVESVILGTDPQTAMDTAAKALEAYKK